MLRKLLDYQSSLAERNRFFKTLQPALNALDTFLFEADVKTAQAPHIRDAVDIKRWMVLVVVALFPAILVAIWNTGLQSFVYSSGDYQLMDEYLASLGSLGDYFGFAFKNQRFLTILYLGAASFIPVMLVSYIAGGTVEAIFAIVRRHEIAEGFLVTGMLVPLILPPTIPLWMVAVGVAVGIILSKELFGGTGMNIMNPAMACRAFLFFAYPTKLSGDVWVGLNSTTVRESLVKMNNAAGRSGVDGYTQATKLAQFNVTPDIKQIHTSAIATNNLGSAVDHYPLIQKLFDKWSAAQEGVMKLGSLTADQLKAFVTGAVSEGGLGLNPGSYIDAYRFAGLQYNLGDTNGDWLFFLGNKLGSMGEPSGLACILGALIIALVGVGSWRTMLSVIVGAFFAASCFEWGSHLLGGEGGAWTAATYGFPAYKHLLLGGLAFGLVYMATDPVSSPDTGLGRVIYGFMIGLVVIVIRVINPAFPEGVMLAIILANCFHPLIDYYVVLKSRRKRRVALA